MARIIRLIFLLLALLSVACERRAPTAPSTATMQRSNEPQHDDEWVTPLEHQGGRKMNGVGACASRVGERSDDLARYGDVSGARRRANADTRARGYEQHKQRAYYVIRIAYEFHVASLNFTSPTTHARIESLFASVADPSLRGTSAAAIWDRTFGWADNRSAAPTARRL